MPNIDYSLDTLPEEDGIDYSLDDSEPIADIPKDEPAISYSLDDEEYLEGDTERDLSEVASDIGVSFGSGVGALMESVGDIYGLSVGDMDNIASTTGEEIREYFTSRKTNQLKQMEDNRKTKIDAAEGEWSKAGIALWETVKSPSLLGSFLVEQVPMLLPGMGVGRAAGLGAKAAGLSAKAVGRIGVGGAVGSAAAMQGADAGSQAYDDLMALPDEIWQENEEVMSTELSFEEAKKEYALSLSRNAAIASGIVSIGLNSLPGARYLDNALAGTGKKIAGSRLKNAAVGGLGEMFQEAGEEAGGAVASNIAVQQIDPTQETFEGAGEAGGLGAAGGVFGAISGGAQSTKADAQAISQELSTATNVDEILASAESMMETEPGEPISVTLSDIPISRDFSVDGVTETITESADVVLSEIDTRIDSLKLLVKCVS